MIFSSIQAKRMVGVSAIARLVLVLVSFCLISCKVVDFTEKSQLLEIKKAFLDPHNILSSWKSRNFNHCAWFGVTCNPRGRVSELRLSGGNFANSGSCFGNKHSHLSLHGFGIVRNCSLLKNGRFLGGKLSNLIGGFSELRVLSLPFNQIRGELPSGIWGLKNLEVIDIEGNSITANLSVINFANLKNLQVVNLGFNKLFGEIPNSLSKCKYLSILNLAGNRIGGYVPDFLGNFVKLKVINLSLNRFNGILGDKILSNCDDLEHFDASGNFLNGEIPNSLGNCSNLRTMLLFSNRFSGSLPVELGNLRFLEVLDVSRNRLAGVIPPSIGNCVKLSVLILSSDINGNRKYGMNDMIKDGNFFSSSLPLQVTMLPNLKLIWAPNSNLDSEFPRNWGACRTLRMVNLAGNRLKGNISGVFENCPNLDFLDISSNQVSGVLDDKLHVPCMTLFDVSRNLMFGSIPDFKISPCGRLNFSRQVDPYLSYFAHKTRVTNRLPLSRSTPAMIHDFSDNNFTGSIPLLPMVSKDESHYKKIDYAFLAGGNRLSGTLFHDNSTTNCNDLNGFFLNVSNNFISGEISPNIGVSWKCLKFLDASKNQISGPIPRSLSVLKNLTVLLNNNKLSGEIPSGFFTSKPRVVFNFSFNNLSGSINKDHGAINCKRIIGNPLLHACKFVKLLSAPPQEPWAVDFDPLNSTGSTNGEKKGANAFELILIIVPSIIIIVLAALVIVYLCQRKQKPSPNQSPSPVVAGASPRPPRSPHGQHGQQESLVVFKEIGVILTLDTVVQATGNFTSRNCIGSGGFGSTYRAEISPGITVAVKRLTVEMCQGVPQFNAEIRSLGRIRHPNLITLIGYYASTSEMFLIYNYLPGGNLETFILEKRAMVNELKVLHKIALDVGNALYFLHDQCHPRILHRDVKPSNILLDENFNAYLSDFGLSRLLDDFETHVTTDVAGTFGYVAPEYALTCRASEKADVYSYGVMLLELISDKRALDVSFSDKENGYTIVTWALTLRREGRSKEVFTAGLWEAGPEDILMEMLMLGLICTADSVTLRPTMRQVVRKLKQMLHASDS